MHDTRCSQVGTLGVWRDSSHPPNPPSPFINLNYASSWSKRLFSACLKIRNGFCCGSVSLKFSDCQAIWRELKLSSSSQIQDDYWLKSVEKYLMLLDIEFAIKEGYCVHVICCFMDL